MDEPLRFGGLKPETEYDIILTQRTNNKGEIRLPVTCDGAIITSIEIQSDPKQRYTNVILEEGADLSMLANLS